MSSLEVFCSDSTSASISRFIQCGTNNCITETGRGSVVRFTSCPPSLCGIPMGKKAAEPAKADAKGAPAAATPGAPAAAAAKGASDLDAKRDVEAKRLAEAIAHAEKIRGLEATINELQAELRQYQGRAPTTAELLAVKRHNMKVDEELRIARKLIKTQAKRIAVRFFAGPSRWRAMRALCLYRSSITPSNQHSAPDLGGSFRVSPRRTMTQPPKLPWPSKNVC